VDEFFSAYPRVRTYLHDESEAAVRRGYAISRSGRRCALDAAASDISAQLRLARNMPIQGTSADITKAALARLGPLLPPEATLILCVHDELILLCPHHAVDAAQRALVEGMQQAGDGLLHQVPLVADVRQMDHWGAH
jgi:DNA polymerase-1